MFSDIFELSKEVFLAHNFNFRWNRLQHTFELVENNADLVQVLLLDDHANLAIIKRLLDTPRS